LTTPAGTSCSAMNGILDAFNRILMERGLEWKHEEFLGWTHISIYRPGYEFTGWVSYNYKA